MQAELFGDQPLQVDRIGLEVAKDEQAAAVLPLHLAPGAPGLGRLVLEAPVLEQSAAPPDGQRDDVPAGWSSAPARSAT